MLRFAVLGLLATELLFLRMPWKPAHLVPCVLALVLWIAASDRNRRPFLWLVIGAMVLNGLVTFRPFIADAPDSTGGGDFEPAITTGWLVNDILCRADVHARPATPRLGCVGVHARAHARPGTRRHGRARVTRADVVPTRTRHSLRLTPASSRRAVERLGRGGLDGGRGHLGQHVVGVGEAREHDLVGARGHRHPPVEQGVEQRGVAGFSSVAGRQS